MTETANPADLLREYLQALSSKNAAAIESLFDEQALLEIPFLKPNRLVGKTELATAHAEIFGTLDSIRFEASAIEADSGHAIAAGKIEFARDGEAANRLDAAIVAESSRQRLQRLSLYCDARNIRPWSDRTIL